MMTMMRKASSIVLLLGLIAVTKGCCGDAKKYTYILTPKPLDAADKKHSKAEDYREARKKWMTKAIEAEALEKTMQDAEKVRDDWKKKLADADAITEQTIQEDEAKVAPEATLTTDWETAKAEHTRVSEEKCPEDQKTEEQKAGWKQTHDEQVETQKTAMDAAQDKLQKAKDKVTADKAIFKEAKTDKKYPDDQAQRDADSEEGRKKLCPWAKTLADKQKAFDNAEKKYNEKVQANCYTKKDGKDEPVDLDDGGSKWWKNKADEALRTMAKREVGVDDKWKDIKVLGFFGDDNQVLIESTQELEAVQKIFKDEIAEDKDNGYGVKEYTIADVKKADKDAKPDVTTDHYLKITNGLKAYKNHAAQIVSLNVYLEEVTSQRDQRAEKEAGKWDPKPKSREGKGIVPQAPFTKLYLNYQVMQTSIYKQAAANFGDRWTDETDKTYQLPRESGDYEVLGNLRDLSGAKPASKPGDDTTSGSSDKKEGTNGWMIVGIICLIVIFLGGAIIAYRAYTASGSAQNTDM